MQTLQVLGQVEPFVYEWTSKHHGSISAEHGLGLMKANKIHYSKSTESVSLLEIIDNVILPRWLINIETNHYRRHLKDTLRYRGLLQHKQWFVF